MPKIVELPGNRTVEFPDDFTEDRMNVEILHAFPDLAKGGVLEPGIPLPGEMGGPGKVFEPLAPGQAFPAREQEMREAIEGKPTLADVQQRYKAGELPLLNRPETMFPETEQVEVPVFGEPGTVARGVSETVSGLAGWVINNPEEFLASLWPPTRLAVMARYAPEIGKQAVEDIASASKGDRQALGRVIGLATLVLGPKAVQEAKAQYMLRGPPRQPMPPVDAAARQALEITPEKITPTEVPPPAITMEPVGAGAGRVLVPKARELRPAEAEDIFGLAKLTEADNAEIAAATETLKTEAPLTAAELAKEVHPAPLQKEKAVEFAEELAAKSEKETQPSKPENLEVLQRGFGASAYWIVVDHEKGNILATFGSKQLAEDHLSMLKGEKTIDVETVSPEPPPTAPEAKAPEPTPPAKVEPPALPDLKSQAEVAETAVTQARLKVLELQRQGVKGKALDAARQEAKDAYDNLKKVQQQVAESKPAAPKRKPVERPWDIIDELQGSVGKIRNKKNARAGSEGYYGEGYNRAQQGAGRGLFSKTGQSPDEALDTLRRSGVLRENATVDDLWDAIENASNVRRKIYKGETPQIQADKFQSALSKEAAKKGAQTISVGDLVIGDKFRVGGEELEVTDIHPDTGEVTVKDGRKFGVQTVPDGADIPIEPGSMEKKTKPTPIPQKPAPPTAKLRPGEKGTGDLLQNVEQPFNLAGEKVEFVPPKVETTKFGGETLTQNELFSIQKVVNAVDPGKSADAAQAIYGGASKAAQTIKRQLSVMDADPKVRKDFTKEQRTRLKEVLNLLEQRASETPPTGPGVPTPAEQAEIRAELDDTLGGKAGVPLKPLPPGAANIPVKGLHEIIQDLAKGLKLPIRFGRLTTTKFAGYFKPIADLIGSRRANDITTISHEVGHKLDKHLKLSSDKSIAGELDVLGDPATPGSGSSWTKSKSRAYKLGEGVGEFVRYWLTDPPEAKAKAPKTFAAFETAMNANPDFGDVMRTAQGDIQTWRASPSQARLRSHISIGDNPNKTPYRLRQLTRDLVDDLHIIRVAVDDAQRWLGSKLPPSANPYVLARLLRGAYGRADVFVRHGTVDFKTKAVTLGKSLQDALKPIAGRVDEFRDYIVAKRAQELHSQGRNSGLLDQDIQATVQHYANDTAFQKAFDDIKEWQDSLLKYARDAGLITDDGLKAMRKMNQDYVPFHRLFEIGAGEISSLESPGLGRGLNLGKPSSLRGLHGSPRPIVDPLETMIKNAYVLTTAAEKQAIHLALADLARSPGMGKWIEKIATPKEMVKVGIEKIRKQLEDAGADLTGVPDDLLLSFFQNSRQAPFGENIIKIVRDGKAEFYRLNRELFDTFHALDMDDAGDLTRLLAAPAQLLRSGVILAPDFALANAFRDAFSSAIVGKYTIFPFEATIRGLAAMLRRPQLVEEWKAAGGANVVEAHYFDRAKMQEFMRKSITSDLTTMEKAVLVAKGPLTFLRWLTGTAEEATRIGEYEVAYRALRKGGMSEGDARIMAAFESRDRQDFAKGGAKTKLLRLWTPFWNAGLQANVKLAQAFRERPFQTTVKGLAFITTAKVIEQALNWDDDDYWDRPQWERDTFFMIPIGKDQAGKTRFLKLPTPFEPGIIFGTLPGRVFQYLRQNDRRAIDGFMQAVAQQTIPNPIPQGLQVIFEDFLAGSKGWDIFRGRQIVPESIADMPVDLQWTEQTSLTARKVGKLIGLSPMKVDHIIASTSGGLGRQLTHNVSDRLIQLTTGEKPTATSQVPGGRFITVPGGIASQSVQDFYDYFQKITAEENRWKAEGKGKEWAGLATDFRRAAGNMSDLRAASRTTSDPLEKQKYAIQIAEIAKVYAAEARKMGVK